jgi:predicted S18 family serine protease
MRVRYLIGIVVIILFTLHFAASGLIGFQGKKSTHDINIEETIQTVPHQNNAEPGSTDEENNSIFSNTILFSLIVVIAGVVAFRRGTNSFYD